MHPSAFCEIEALSPLTKASVTAETTGSRRLGASFFTKLRYFLGWDSAAGSRRPLMMDQYVVIGLNACRSTEWDPLGPWTADQYGECLSWAEEKANTWGVGTEADVVERAVWAYGICLARRR
ncbi:hypothetical protein SAMN05444365_1193 [Micromonospora pattaloongensis]|uniref:Uncharacterized protein n=1 Tax=Micromonospora pattaloongensis TaxID=405436 RepID=A0A1H3T6U1_9ACTN|nr:hypothetical protein SAMN05444365_1193 [Micromonospora pattaloongensis]